jgi:hypothetical protein
MRALTEVLKNGFQKFKEHGKSLLLPKGTALKEMLCK